MSDLAEDLPAMMADAQAHRAAGDLAGAIAIYRRATARHADAWPRHALAETLIQAGELDAADALYTALLENDPDDFHSLMGRGFGLRRRGRTREALPWFRRAVALRLQEVWPRLVLAETLAEAGLHAEAAPAYVTVLRYEPRQMQAMVGLGQALAATGDLQAAAIALRDAVHTHPTEIWPRMALIDALIPLGEAEEAEELCQTILATDAVNLQALVNLAACRRQQGDVAGSDAALQRAMAAHPAEPWPTLVAAGLHADAGQTDRAVELLDRLLARRPASVEAWEALGTTQRRAGRLMAALDAFARAAALDTTRAAPWLECAGILRLLGRVAEADGALRCALAIDPTQHAALRSRAELLELQGRIDLALDLGRAAAALAPTDASNLVLVSRCLALLGRPAEAEAALEPVATQPAAALWRAELAGRAGDWARAVAVLDEAIAAAPRDSALPGARARAAWLAGQAAPLVPPPHLQAAERAAFLVLQGDAAGFELAAARASFRAARRLDPDNAGAAEGDARIALLQLDIPGTREALATLSRLRAAERTALGLVPRPSQTQVGQLLDEFILDADCVADLREAGTMEVQPRAARLREIAGAYPEVTAPAVLLIIAMRQAGYFTARIRAGGGIPKTVGQYWDAGGTLPPDLAALQASWQAEGWRHVCLDAGAARYFLKQHHPPAVQQAFLAAATPEQRADLVRLAWLAVEGGIWADIDDRCLVGPEALIRGVGMLLSQDGFGTLANNVMVVPPAHPLIALALGLATRSLLRGDADMMWLATGPGLLTRAFAQWLPEKPTEWPITLEPLRLLDRFSLAEKVATNCPATYKLRVRMTEAAFPTGD
jgi:tetratricopeptide (TPR) repeat protein